MDDEQKGYHLFLQEVAKHISVICENIVENLRILSFVLMSETWLYLAVYGPILAFLNSERYQWIFAVSYLIVYKLRCEKLLDYSPFFIFIILKIRIVDTNIQFL